MSGPVGSHVAQFNWGILADDWGSPRVADFERNIDRVNAIAARSPGFVWRLDEAAMGSAQAGALRVLADSPRIASTLSVWTGVAPLETFVHKTVHSHFMARSDISHIKIRGPAYVVWPVAVGHRPTIPEALERLDMLGKAGPSPMAFDFNWWRMRAAAFED